MLRGTMAALNQGDGGLVGQDRLHLMPSEECLIVVTLLILARSRTVTARHKNAAAERKQPFNKPRLQQVESSVTGS